MFSLRTALILIFLFTTSTLFAQTSDQQNKPYLQQKRVPNQPTFKINEPDYKRSPFTGMTRKHWKEAGLYLLNGAFSYVDKLDDPMQFPKLPGKSYPRNEGGVTAEKLEGLCRTLFIAAPLLKENPNLVIHNIKVADYYRYQIGKLLDPSSPTFITPRGKGDAANQILVEFGGLSVSLFAIPEILWDPLPQQQKDALAKIMLSYGDGSTYEMNWRFFNIFILSFFKEKGYAVNEKLLVEYVDRSLELYRGNGWYQDNPSYDYYSMWAFQMYGPLWAEFFGKKHYPKQAQKFIENFKDVNDNYPYMFSRNGEMMMWGRSISYRTASIIPFPLMGMVKEPGTNYGWMRRIASGVIKQTLTNPNLMQDNIPTLGMYGTFDPAVQPYSCRGSVFWMGKAFLGLLIPENNPFWNATENEGAWINELVKGKVFNKFQPGSDILITDYPNIGAAEIRAWCDPKATGHKTWVENSENYNRLSYNTAFPWQADNAEGVVSMSYMFKTKKDAWKPLSWYSFKKFENGIYYRDAGVKTNKNIQLALAEMPLPNGILRVDKCKSADTVQMHLGHYSLPEIKGAIKKTYKKIKGYEVCIIDNGNYQLAMVKLKGWNSMKAIDAQGINPVSKNSTVINVDDFFIPKQTQDGIYATLMLWKKSGEKWTDNELLPVNKVSLSTDNQVLVSFTNGKQETIYFN